MTHIGGGTKTQGWSMTMRLLIVLSLLWIVGDGTGSSSIAAEKSGGLADESVEAPLEKPPEPAKGPLRRLEERLEDRLHGATPEEHARLDAERKRLSADAAAFGTDPTAIIGYYQLNYGHSVFTNNLRIDSARLPSVCRSPPIGSFRSICPMYGPI
jgi:hypothetical protein